MSELQKFLTGMKADRAKKRREIKVLDTQISEFTAILKQRAAAAKPAAPKPAAKTRTKPATTKPARKGVKSK